MSKDEIFLQVRDMVVDKFEVDPALVTLEASFGEDLDADSLDLMDLIIELEDRFGIKISDDEARSITTVGAAVDFIAERI